MMRRRSLLGGDDTDVPGARRERSPECEVVVVALRGDDDRSGAPDAELRQVE